METPGGVGEAVGAEGGVKAWWREWGLRSQRGPPSPVQPGWGLSGATSAVRHVRGFCCQNHPVAWVNDGLKMLLLR